MCDDMNYNMYFINLLLFLKKESEKEAGFLIFLRKWCILFFKNMTNLWEFRESGKYEKHKKY